MAAGSRTSLHKKKIGLSNSFQRHVPPINETESEIGIAVDPYTYLIDIKIGSNGDKLGLPDLKQYSQAVQTYLRLLGRNQAVHDLKPDPEKLAQVELAGGWLILRRGRYPSDDQARRGVFIEPEMITPEAIRQCPTMPWLYNLHRDDLQSQLEGGTTLDKSYASQCDLSPYVSFSRHLVVSNVIAPLPEHCAIDQNHPRWEQLIKACYGTAHPTTIVANFPDIMHDNNEQLVIAARDQYINQDFFTQPRHNLGLRKGREETFRAYLRDFMDLELDM